MYIDVNTFTKLLTLTVILNLYDFFFFLNNSGNFFFFFTNVSVLLFFPIQRNQWHFMIAKSIKTIEVYGMYPFR